MMIPGRFVSIVNTLKYVSRQRTLLLVARNGQVKAGPIVKSVTTFPGIGNVVVILNTIVKGTKNEWI